MCSSSSSSSLQVHEDRRVVVARLSGSFNFANSSRVQEEAERLVDRATKEAENEKQKVQSTLDQNNIH